MPTVKSTKQPMRSVKIDLAADLISRIDRISSAELLTRTAWLRRTINSAVKYSYWLEEQEERAERNKQRCS